MAAPVSIDAGWALWGKDQGTRIDYSVLACSAEPLSEAEFTNVLSHFVAGTPSTEPHRPDSLPWVVISRVGVANQVYLGISIQAPAGTKDAAGRPVISTSYFCIPYAGISGAPVTYSGLHEQLDQEVLPYRDDGLIPLSVPRLDPAAVTRDIIKKFGESMVTDTAAMLLSGPVSIVGAEETELTDRLAFIDAVAALLPYGYRGAYTAATWSDSGTRHPIRLAFASRPRQNAGVIRWKAGTGTPLTGASEEYLAQYHRIRDRLRETDTAGRSEQLTKLITALAGDSAPCGWDQPERALQALRDFNLPFDVLSAIRAARLAATAVGAGSVDSAAGSVKSADVRRVFTESRIDQLEPDQRMEVLAELIATAYREPANWPVADEWWEHVTQGDSLPLLPRILETVQHLLLVSAPSVAIREYLNRADTHGILDPLLAGLVAEPKASSRASRMAGARAVAEQIADSVSREPGPAAFPQTQQALAGNPLIASLLLAHLARAERELEVVLAWLAPVLGGPLALFFTVLRPAHGMVSPHDAGVVDQHDIEALAGYGAGCVVALLTAADDRGHLDPVLRAFTRWLGRVRLGSAEPERVRYLRDHAMALRPTGSGTQVQLDLVLLISGDPPRFLLDGRDKPSQQRYNQNLARAWAELVGDLGLDGDRVLTRALRNFITGGRWVRDVTQAAAVIGLVGLLTRDDQRPSLSTAAREVLARTPEARGWPFARDLLPPAPQGRHASTGGRSPAPESQRRAIESKPPASEERHQPAPESARSGAYGGRDSAQSFAWQEREQQQYPAPKTYQPDDEPARTAASRPDTGKTKIAASRSVLSEDTTEAEVADYCLKALVGRRSLDDVIEAMLQAGVIRTGAKAAAVLDELEPSFISSSGKYPEAGQWLERLTENFAEGRFGPEVADEFRTLVAQASIKEINHRINVLRTVLARDESSTEQLNQAIKSLEEIRKSAEETRKSLEETRRDGKKRPRTAKHAWGRRPGGDREGEPG